MKTVSLLFRFQASWLFFKQHFVEVPVFTVCLNSSEPCVVIEVTEQVQIVSQCASLEHLVVTYLSDKKAGDVKSLVDSEQTLTFCWEFSIVGTFEHVDKSGLSRR